MDLKKINKLLLKIAVTYWIFVTMIYCVAGDGFQYAKVSSDGVSPHAVVGEIVDGVEVQQTVTIPADSVTELELLFATFGRTNTGSVNICLTDMDGTVLSQWELDVSALTDSVYAKLALPESLDGRNGDQAVLHITSEGAVPGNAVTLYYGSTISTGRHDVALQLSQDELYRINDVAGNGKLCLKFDGINHLSFYRYYWYIVVAVFVLMVLCVWRANRLWKQGKNTLLLTFVHAMTQYQFLIKQLVGRDFKVKYKRSVLGVAWSFFNPLLTMMVQYVVFSTLFRSNIENFQVYLMTGIVFFNFFLEASSLGLSSITGNASLIKKVYIPKYIYPVSRVLSALVNFAISLIPLLLVMLVAGVPYRLSLLLLLYDLVCLVGFATGMALLLSTSMTFFQDTLHLWGVISMMWNYLTPIFYPETIIPLTLLPLFRMNPMYQYITFARTCILDGVSPEPQSYLWCILSSLLALALGVSVFRKHQDKFVLYI